MMLPIPDFGPPPSRRPARFVPVLADCMTLAPYHSIVYGPVKSRRYGNALGVNLAPSPCGDCGADCLYCRNGVPEAVPIISRAKGLPSSGVIVTSVARKVIELQRAGEKLDTILVAGNQDPTMHPYLLEISENLRDLRTKWFPKAKLVLVSESEGLTCPELRAVCVTYDRANFRFEWGTAKTYQALRPEATLDYKTLCERLNPVDRWIAQATFVQGSIDNSNDREVAAWIKKLEELRPREVQLFTPEGRPKNGVKAVPAARLEEIAAKWTEKTGVAAEVMSLEALAAV
jgi:wyosine [tRNA(Phe)-imidazoG37] synthetase (radical SAM superfamily)